MHPEVNLGDENLCCVEFYITVLWAQICGVSWVSPQNALSSETESSIGYCLGIFQFQVIEIIFKLTKEKRRTFWVHLN